MIQVTPVILYTSLLLRALGFEILVSLSILDFQKLVVVFRLYLRTVPRIVWDI